jgi:hypothetical protein
MTYAIRCCRPYGAWMNFDDHPALTRWANNCRPFGTGQLSLRETDRRVGAKLERNWL